MNTNIEMDFPEKLTHGTSESAPIQRLDFAQTRQLFLPLPGKRAGVRADYLSTNFALEFVESSLSLLSMHWDHEPRANVARPSSAAGAGGVSPPVPPPPSGDARRTRRRDACATVHGKPPVLQKWRHWDHEPSRLERRSPTRLDAGEYLPTGRVGDRRSGSWKAPSSKNGGALGP